MLDQDLRPSIANPFESSRSRTSAQRDKATYRLYRLLGSSETDVRLRGSMADPAMAFDLEEASCFEDQYQIRGVSLGLFLRTYLTLVSM